MNTLSKSAALLAVSCITSNAAITLLSEDWQDAGWSGTDINVSPNNALSDFVGYGVNNDNPTTLLGAGTGGNVLRDQTGFGGTYGSATSAGNSVRVRSSNGAMLNENALELVALNLTSITFSFDLRQNTANYHQVVEFSNNTGFLTTGQETTGINNTVLRLDTFTGDTDLTLWLAKSYTLVDGVDVAFTDNSYFRIRKLRPSPTGTNAGANSTSHAYDNLLITGVEAVPEPSGILLGAIGALALFRRRR